MCAYMVDGLKIENVPVFGAIPRHPTPARKLTYVWIEYMIYSVRRLTNTNMTASHTSRQPVRTMYAARPVCIARKRPTTCGRMLRPARYSFPRIDRVCVVCVRCVCVCPRCAPQFSPCTVHRGVNETRGTRIQPTDSALRFARADRVSLRDAPDATLGSRW